MNVFLQLSLMALVPSIFSVIIYMSEVTRFFRRMEYMQKQLLFGFAFGVLAILGTEVGVKIDGAILNVRDTAPLCAGLLFGAPAGIISGLIGGVERWFAVLWGAGEYTRLACSVSTVFAGFISAFLRKFMFDNKKPTWYYSYIVGVIVEVIHMLMIFITNMSDVRTAFEFVRICSVPMISINSASIMVTTLVITFISKKYRQSNKCTQRKISQTFQRWLLLCVSIGFFFTMLFTWKLQTRLSETDTYDLAKLNIEDVRQDIKDASNKNLVSLTQKIAKEVNESGDITSNKLNYLASKYDVAEINVIDENGIIISTTYGGFLYYNMREGEQASEFMVLLDSDTKEYVQEYMPTSSNPDLLRKYAGVVLDRGGFIQVAYDAKRFQKDIDDEVIGVTHNRHVGENGYIIIVDTNWNIVSDRLLGEGQNLIVTGIYIDRTKMPENEPFQAKVYGTNSYCLYVVSEGYYIIAVIPYTEAFFSRDMSVYVTVFMDFVIFGILFIWVYLLIKKLIVENISRVNRSLAQITEGNLEVTVNVRSNEEFASLSDDINSTVVTLKHYITEAAARIDKELEFAKEIQHSALPTITPSYSKISSFDIFASMYTAKEVGGDFYDFYFIDKNRLAFLIADVSGKGIPAAMFMMTSKTLLKDYLESGKSVNDVLTIVNKRLCEKNSTGMFVTAWMGVINLNTGLVEYSNAGHNPPLVRSKNGEFEYIDTSADFILAGMDDVEYSKNELQLSPGDEIFLYTDGVTEATDANKQLYGEKRLLEFLNTLHGISAQEMCDAVKADVDEFVKDAPQFDDITILCLKYNGTDKNVEFDKENPEK